MLENLSWPLNRYKTFWKMNAYDKSTELRTGEYHEGGGHQITWAMKTFFQKNLEPGHITTFESPNWNEGLSRKHTATG